jgi:hypothetical protein
MRDTLAIAPTRLINFRISCCPISKPTHQAKVAKLSILFYHLYLNSQVRGSIPLPPVQPPSIQLDQPYPGGPSQKYRPTALQYRLAGPRGDGLDKVVLRTAEERSVPAHFFY